MGLNVEQVRTLTRIAKLELAKKGEAFFKWMNAPEFVDGRIIWNSGDRGTIAISPQESLRICKSKLDGVYAERLVLALSVAAAAVKAGKDVDLLQIEDEPGSPFDANGWLVLAFNGYPIFHISPSDLPADVANEAGLVTVVRKGTPEAERFAWKNTTKLDELTLLLDLLL